MRRIVALDMLLMLLIFTGDAFLPIPFDIHFAYMLVILITFWTPGIRLTFDAAIIATGLTIVAYFASVHHNDLTTAIGNRILTIAGTWAGAFVIIKYKLSQETLITHRERLDALFEFATEGIIISNAKGEIVLANPQAEKQFGYGPGQLTGKSIETLIPQRFKDKHVGHRKSYFHTPRSRSMGKGIELFARKKDDYEFPVEISLSTFVIKEELFAISFIIDITERRKQEEQISKAHLELQEKAEDILQMNEKLELRVKNRTEELAKTNEALELLNKKLVDNIDERLKTEDALRESQKLYSVIAENFPNGIICVFDRNFRYIFIDGKELWELHLVKEDFIHKTIDEVQLFDNTDELKQFLARTFDGENLKFDLSSNDREYTLNTVALQDSKGVIKEILVVIKNTTERKRAEKEIQHALIKERELSEMKSRFVSLASHEFRTPLSTILSSVSLVASYNKQEDLEKRNKHIERIKSSVKNLTEILNEFLSLEKLETGKIHCVPVQFDFKEFGEEIKEEMQSLAKKGQKIEYVYTGSEEHVMLDKQLLKNVCINLLNNAIKYSSEGQIIRFKTKAENNFAELTVTDQGLGIPKVDQPHLFERFYRAQNAIGIQGTGLGLNIVRKYIDLMGGSIFYTSEENIGSTFTVRIPFNNHNL